MPDTAEAARQVAWFSERLAENRQRVRVFLDRLANLGSGILPPALFAKFDCWMNEIAAAKREEMRLMLRIEAIEKAHQDMRKSRRLRQAKPSWACVNLKKADEYDKAYRPLRTLVWMVVLWYLFVRQKINQKKQSLTAN